MRRIITTILLLLLTVSWLSDPASAALPDLVYHTMDFPNGAMGTLEGIDPEGSGGEGDIVRVNVYGDAVLYSYIHKGKMKILLAEHCGYGLGKDVISIFDPGEWASPQALTEEESFSWDMRGFAYDESYFYIANLMQGRITKVRIDDFHLMSESCDLAAIDTGEVFDDEFGHLAEDLILASDGYLYALDQTYWQYPLDLGPGTVVKIDPVTMEVIDWAKVGDSPWDMAVHEGYVYVSCFGGSMFENGYKETDQTLLQRVPMTGMLGNTQVIADGSLLNSEESGMNGYMLLEIGDDGTLYTTSYQIKDPFSAKVFIGNISDLTDEKSFTAETLNFQMTFAGWSRASLMDRTRNICWISDSGTRRNDSKLVAFGPDGVIGSYTGGELGGYPNMLTLAGENRPLPPEENRSPSVPGLLSPEDGESVSRQGLTLKWSPAVDPDGDTLSYRIFFGRSEEEMSAVATVSGREYLPLVDAGGSYVWAVEADDDRDGKARSATWTFEVEPEEGQILGDVSPDSYLSTGIETLNAWRVDLDLEVLEGFTPVGTIESGDVSFESVEPVLYGVEGILAPLGGMSFSLDDGGEDTYVKVELGLRVQSDDLEAWEEGLWDSLTSSTADPEALKVSVLERIHPFKILEEETVDLVVLARTASSENWQDWFEVTVTPSQADGQPAIIVAVPLVVADGGQPEVQALRDGEGQAFFLVFDGEKDGVLEDPLAPVLMEKKKDTSKPYSFSSSTGCRVGFSTSSLLLAVPLLVCAGRRWPR